MLLVLTFEHVCNLMIWFYFFSGFSRSSVGEGYAEIVVVRHGETSWNAERKIQVIWLNLDWRSSKNLVELGSVVLLQGHLDVELNDAGRQQAEKVCDFLSFDCWCNDDDDDAFWNFLRLLNGYQRSLRYLMSTLLTWREPLRLLRLLLLNAATLRYYNLTSFWWISS